MTTTMHRSRRTSDNDWAKGHLSMGAKKLIAGKVEDFGSIIHEANTLPKQGRRNSAQSLSCSNLRKEMTGFTCLKKSAAPCPTSLSQKHRRHSSHAVSYASEGASSLTTVRKCSHAVSYASEGASYASEGSAYASEGPCYASEGASCATKRRASSVAGSAMNCVKDQKAFLMAKSESSVELGSLAPQRRSSVRLPPMPVAGGKSPMWAKVALAVHSKSLPSDPFAVGDENSPTGNSNNMKKQNSPDTPSTSASWNSEGCFSTPEGDTDKDGDQESLIDVNFVIENAPTVTEAAQRFQSGYFSDTEVRRVHRAFRRFAGSEEDLDKESLDLVTSHLGYILMPEEAMGKIANSTSDMSGFDAEELINFLQALAPSQGELLDEAFARRARAEGATGSPLQISAEGLPLLMIDLHIITLRQNMAELMQRAGLGGQTSVTREDVVQLLAAYRTCEGFTVEDLRKAQESFKEAADDNSTIAVSEVANALLDFFGVGCVKQLRELVEAAGEALSYCGMSTCPVTFHEFVIWARHLQNAELLELWEHFETYEDEGKVTFDEAKSVLRQQGFTLSLLEIHEFLEAADLSTDEDTLYTFDDVHALLQACQEGEGFSSQDVEELKAAHAKFDTEDEGELTTLQVLDLLRFLGYQVQIEDVEHYAKEVDFNGNGTMDVDEYLRLMRLHAEDELAEMQKVFFKCVGGPAGRLPFAGLHHALKECQCCSSHCDVFEELLTSTNYDVTTVDMGFDEFRGLAVKGRKIVKRAQRRKATFADDEFAVLRQAFALHDTSNQGVLDQKALLHLLHRSGIPVDMVGQKWGVAMLDKARNAALEADLSPEDVGQLGTFTMTFWGMIHAWRLIARESETKKFDRSEEARAACAFSTAEVDEFQKVFFEHTKLKGAEAEEEDTQETTQQQNMLESEGRRRSMPDLYCSGPKQMQAITREMLNTAKDTVKVENAMTLTSVLGTQEVLLEYPDFKKILGSLGLKVGPSNMDLLAEKMEDLTGDCEGSLDFPNFLRFMRWMLDTNFARLNDRTAAVAKNVPPEPVAATTTGSPRDERQGSKGSRMEARRRSAEF